MNGKHKLRFICLLTALLLCLTTALTACKDGGKTPAGTTPDESGGGREGVSGEYAVTPGLLVYYMYRAAGSFTEEQLKEHNFDESPDVSLKDQMYDETHTWYDMLVIIAENMLTSVLTYCNAAAADGIVLDDNEQMAVESSLTSQRVTAASYGYELDPYLEYVYGNKYVTEEVLKYAFELEELASKYEIILEKRFHESLTDEMVNEQVESAGGERDKSLTRRLGQIIFTAEAFGTVDAAEAEAKYVLGKIDKSAAEASFAEFAGEYDQAGDTLYFENVARNDMIDVIDEWLYASGRKTGDMDIVVSDYGVHLLYYVSDGDPVYIANAKLAIVDRLFEEWYGRMKAAYSTGITDDMIAKLDLDF